MRFSVLLENNQWHVIHILILTSENIDDNHLPLFVLNLYNKKKITQWLEDMNFTFSWWKQF